MYACHLATDTRSLINRYQHHKISQLWWREFSNIQFVHFNVCHKNPIINISFSPFSVAFSKNSERKVVPSDTNPPH